MTAKAAHEDESVYRFKVEVGPLQHQEGGVPVSAPAILRAGIAHMEDRAKTYDKKGERSMAATVAAFSAVTGISLTEADGWLFMCLLKMVRSRQGAYRADNFEDLAAYAGLLGECAAKEAKND